MTIDIRATARCSLGPLISASISDDYIQGNGLIKISGSCEIAGTVTPAPGTIVTFSYTKSGITRQIPRTLRVLSSSADPYRKITSVKLGCKLTYLEDLKQPINWDAFDDPANSDRSQAESSIVTVPISANSLMIKCLQELGLNTNVAISLTNQFSIAEFDFSSGYVNILGNLLISECYCGYIGINEMFTLIDLKEQGGSGPLLDSSKLIDVSPIGSGELQADAVTVSYSSLKLKTSDGTELDKTPPDKTQSGETTESLWGADFDKSETRSKAALTWTYKGVNSSRVYDVLSRTQNTTTYRIIEYKDENGKLVRKNVVNARLKDQYDSSIVVAGNLYTAWYSSSVQGFGPGSRSSYEVKQSTFETFTYDSQGEEVQSISTTYVDAIYALGSFGLDICYPTGCLIPGQSTIATEKIIVDSFRGKDGFTVTRTQKYVAWPKTVQGQQSIAASREFITTLEQAVHYINLMYNTGLQLYEENIETRVTGSRTQQAPLPSDVTNEKNSDNNNNGFTTESKSEIELITGNRSATRRIDLTLPYAPDDIFIKSDNKYYSRSSDAAQKAKNYGVVQNKMLFGNRSGMNIQVSAENMPITPFSPIFIEGNGVVGLYRLNGTSWTVDSNGIIASTDAMFWGTAGTTS
jgi:hypothetical protein